MKCMQIADDHIFTIDDFMSPDECRSHIEASEDRGYEVFNIDGEVIPGFRNNSRCVFEDNELAEVLWERAREFVPQSIGNRQADGFNPVFRYYRYQGDESFKVHHDGCVRIGEALSELTFMVYLADVESGGETQFYDEDFKPTFAVRPQQGKALAFEHLILHEGAAVTEGTKYVLRTDVMYK